METFRIFGLIENFGVEIFFIAFLVCLTVRAVKKIFPSVPPKAETLLRMAAAVLFYCVYLLAVREEFTSLIGRSVTVFGVSYAICGFFGDNGISPVKETIALFFPEEDAGEIEKKVMKAESEEEVNEILSRYHSVISGEDLKRFGEIVFKFKALPRNNGN